MKHLLILTLVGIIVGASLAISGSIRTLISGSQEYSFLISPPELRFKELESYFPQIFQTEKELTLFVGDSNWKNSLDPIVADRIYSRLGMKMDTWNFSFDALKGRALSIFTQRIIEELEKNERKVNTVYLSFCPLSYSRKSYLSTWSLTERYLPQIFSAELATKDYGLLYGIETFVIASFPPLDLQPIMRSIQTTSRNPITKKLSTESLWTNSIFWEDRKWDFQKKGFSYWNLPSAESEFQRVLQLAHQPEEWAQSVEFFSENLGLDSSYAVSPELFSSLLSSIDRLQNVTEKIVVVIPPYPPALRDRLKAHVKVNKEIEQLERIPKVVVLDLQHSELLSDKDFVDPLHPTREAMDRIMEVILKNYHRQ